MEQKSAGESYLVMGTASLTEEKTIVLKHNQTFAIFNKYGDIIPYQFGAQGIFHKGTRYLSHFRFKIDGVRPLFLSSNLRERSEMFVVDLTNPDIREQGHLKLEKGSAHILRKKVIWDSTYYEHFIFSNFGLEEIEFNIELKMDADFEDIFEVRGTPRPAKGTRLPIRIDENILELGYIGVDQLERTTRVILDPNPHQMDDNRIYYNIRLNPGEKFTVTATLSFITAGVKRNPPLDLGRAVKRHERWFDLIDHNSCVITTSNEQFNHWINRSRTDLITMISQTPHGLYPYAGIPWYDTPFGRDGIITALECLWVSPEVARGVLQFLAATQASELDSFRDSEPGKILHESREGEMALLDEIPFRQYYGTIDATPLFIVLAGAYYIRTADLDTIKGLWGNIQRALEWIDNYGDINKDGFVEYQRREESGLFNQGWKDSHDAISYEDGNIARLPIALCEVQGYVYDAWQKAALLAEALGNEKQAGQLRQKAQKLRKKFTEHFWDEEKGSFHLAIADGKPCRVLSSNAGHCLYSRIATPQQAERLAGKLLSDEMFTGWGIRTLSAAEVRYNPMSYHNGSIWPHDNALIAAGLASYGLKEEVIKIGTALFDASHFNEGQRLPELFCGFKRRKAEAPTSYPVACSPQAWSVATVFIILQAFLGMEINEHERVIRFFRPSLPAYIDNMSLQNLRFRNLRLTMHFIRTGNSVSISIENKNVRLEVVY